MQYYQYTPVETGNYTFKFDYPQQTYTWTPAGVTPAANYTGDIFLGASKTITLVVQDEQIPAPLESYPLPTEYWSRPIEGQNTYWYTTASNWLGTPYIIGAAAGYGIPGAIQPDGSAPNSAHVMWTKPIQYGGVVGGNDTAIPGEMWYSGLSYNVRFSNPLIIQGTLYYQEPYGNGAAGGDYVAVNLQTGKELWRINASATGVSLAPSFGYVYTYESPNQHGVLPNGLLIATQGGGFGGGPTAWRAYDPRTGVLTTMNVTNVPSGTNVAGPQGEYLKYILTNLGNSTNPNWYLAQWNSTNVIGGGQGLSPTNWYSGSLNANVPITPARPTTSAGAGQAWNWNGIAWVAVPSAQATSTTPSYDWNISLPTLKGTGWSVGMASLGVIPLVTVNGMMLLVQGTFGGHPGDFYATVTTDPANITAISLKQNAIGQVLWTNSYQQAPGNNTRLITDWDPSSGVFVFCDKESMTHYGYSLTDGSYLWGPTVLTNDFTTDYNYMAIGLERAANGKLYFTGYSGILYTYDLKTGKLLWTYGNGGEGNTTLSGFATPYGRYPTFISVIADGKVYLDTTEHSPNSPLYKGARFRAINATDGTELWTILDYGNQMYGGQAAVADGYLATLNSYDSQIYVFGKGPSATTVTAPDVAATLGTSIVLKGTVTDIAAGTKQDQQAARFPNGVPAVSDASMGPWMEYVYMQKPRPTNVVGVEVVLSVLDANNNFREIGKTTTDSNGFYSFNWNPDIAGKYTLYASFAGSESYWPSNAVTAFAVDPAPQAPTTETQPPQTSMTDTYLVAGVAVIVVAIAIVGAVLGMMLRKRQ